MLCPFWLDGVVRAEPDGEELDCREVRPLGFLREYLMCMKLVIVDANS